MISSPPLVSSRMALAKSSAGFDGICWAGWFISSLVKNNSAFS